MTPAQLRQLMALAEAKKARDLARLDALLQRERALEGQITAARRAHFEDHASGALDAAPPALQDLRLTWADHRVAEAQRGQAALRPDIRAARAEATRSLGKHEAIAHLLERAERDARARKEARLERDIPDRKPES